MNEIIRKNLIEEIKINIKAYQDDLLQQEVGSEQYNNSFNELTILKKELDLLLRLTPSNFESTMRNLSYITDKYEYLADLLKEKLDAFLSVVEEYNGFVNGFTTEIKIEENLADFKNRALLSEIKIKNLCNSSECAELIELASNMKTEFLDNSEKFKKQLSLVDFTCYNTLFLNVKNKTLSNLDVIKYFYKLDQGTLIDIIIKERDELQSLKKSSFKTKKVQERIDYLSNKLLVREESLLKNINYYILSIIENIEKDLYIVIDENKYLNLTSLYYETLDKIDIKEQEYGKIIKNLKFIFEMFARMEKGFRTKMNLIDPNLNNELKSKDIDISLLDKDRINSIKASIEVYRKFSQPNLYWDNEKSKGLKF